MTSTDRVLACLVFLLGLGLTTEALAKKKPTIIRITNTSTVEARGDNGNETDEDDDYFAGINRLNLQATEKKITTNIRLDAMGFIDSPTPWRENDARVERINVIYRVDKWRLTFGDYYRQLGRGLALSLRKVDQVGFDMGLRGAQAEYKSKEHRFGLFGGRANSVNIDTRRQKFIEDPEDILTGGWYGWRAKKWFHPGVHYVFRQNRLKEGLTDDASHTVGATIKMPRLKNMLTLFLEGDYQQTRTLDAVSDGFAAYASMTFTYKKSLSLLMEGIYLSTFNQLGSAVGESDEPVRYNQPPTLERKDQETSVGAFERGLRSKLKFIWDEGDKNLYVNGMYKQVNPDEPDQFDQLHVYGGTELAYDNGRSRLNTSGGWRDENFAGENDAPIKSMFHGEFDLIHSLKKKWALQLAANWEFREQPEDGDGDGFDQYNRGSAFIGIQKAGAASLTFEYGRDGTPSGEDVRVRENFFSAMVKMWASRKLQVQATIGTQRGGLKCVAGVCRIYPSFAGGKIDVIAKHNLLSN